MTAPSSRRLTTRARAAGGDAADPGPTSTPTSSAGAAAADAVVETVPDPTDPAATDAAPASSRRSQRPDPTGTLAQRLHYLLETVHAPGVAPYTVADIAAWAAVNGTHLRSDNLYKIFRGSIPNPRFRTLSAIAEFFGVPLDYFHAAQPQPIDGAALDLAIRLRRPEIAAARTAAQLLPPRAHLAFADIVDTLLRGQNLPDGAAERARCNDLVAATLAASTRLLRTPPDAIPAIIEHLAALARGPAAPDTPV